MFENQFLTNAYFPDDFLTEFDHETYDFNYHMCYADDHVDSILNLHDNALFSFSSLNFDDYISFIYNPEKNGFISGSYQKALMLKDSDCKTYVDVINFKEDYSWFYVESLLIPGYDLDFGCLRNDFLRYQQYQDFPIFHNFHNDSSILTEKFRFRYFDNGYYLFQSNIVVVCDNDLSYLLMLCGDVEENPGPVHTRCDGQCGDSKCMRTNKDLTKINDRLKKLLIKQNNHIQRMEEKQKTLRKKNQRRAKAQGLYSFSNNLGTIASSFSDNVGPTFDAIQQVLDSFLQLSKQFQSLFSIPEKYDLVNIILTLTALLRSLYDKSIFLVSIHATQLARHLGCTLSNLMSLLPQPGRDTVDNPVSYNVASESVQFSTPVSQSFTDHLDALNKPEVMAISSVATFVVGLFGYLFSGSFPSAKTIMKESATFGRAAIGFRTIKDFILYLSNKVMSLYYYYAYGVSAEEFEFMQAYPDVENLYAAVKLIQDLERITISSSAAIANQIIDVEKRIQTYIVKASKISDRANVNFLQNLLKAIRGQIDAAQNSPARTQLVREVPFSLYLYGQPGVGKSVMQEVLTARLYRKYLADRGVQYPSLCFTRMAQNEYWEGYTGQPIIILDDFGNAKDSVQAPVPEYAEILRMVNTCNYPLNMAAVELKANTPFISEFLIASSNQRVPDIKSLVDPGAVYRRFHLWAEVSIDPSYGVEKGRDDTGKSYYVFDEEKAKAKIGNNFSPLTTEHYRINLYSVTYDKSKGSVNTAPIVDKLNLSFDEFCDYYMQRIDSHRVGTEKLASAIRKEAGVEEPKKAPTERELMERFNDIFEPKEIIEAVGDVQGEDFTDAVKDSLFASLIPSDDKMKRIEDLYNRFNQHKKECAEALRARFSKLTSKLSNGLSSIGTFLATCFSFMSDKINSYLPSLSENKPILATVSVLLTTLVAGFATVKLRTSICSFCKDPTTKSNPCMKCEVCKVVSFPSSCDFCAHYANFISSSASRTLLKNKGVPDKTIEYLLDYSFKFYAQNVYDKNVQIASHTSFAQNQYDKNVVSSKHTPFAQNVYDNAARQSTHNRFAQTNYGVVEAKTDIICGSQIYAQRDRVRIEQTTQVLLHNSVWVQAADEDGLANRSNGTFLVGRTLVTTAHTLNTCPKDKPVVNIYITNPYSDNPCICVPIDRCKISYMKQLDGNPVDLALISFPSVVPNRPKILNKFIDSDDIGYLNEGSMVFSGFTKYNDKTIVQEKYISDFEVSSKTVEYVKHTEGQCPHSDWDCTCIVRIGNHIEYDLETTAGTCGSLLSLSNNLIHSKLFGLHVAGGPGSLALGVLTTQQFLQSNLDAHIASFNIPASYLIDGRLPYSQAFIDHAVVPDLIHKGDCLAVGVAKQPLTANKSQLQPSAIHDKIQTHITKPAYLKPIKVDGVIKNPMELGVKKLMGSQSWIDDELLEIALNDVFTNIGFPSSGSGLIHSYEESIKGVDGDPYKRPINRTTSPGYPYNLSNPSKGKTFWLGNDEVYILDNVELKQDVEDLISKARKGVRGDAISIATLKDEKRPLAKVEAGKTRVFEACPQHLVLAIRQYFLDFNAHFMRHRIKNGFAVGINPYSLEWTKVAHHLLTKGNNMVAGDFSNFDGSLVLQVTSKVCEYINRWYNDGEENALIRMTLWEHISNADVLIDGEIIRQTHSQPSGNPLTVVLNSIFNACIMRVAYLMLKKEQNLPIVCDYNKYVSEIIYGDDDVKSIHAQILPWFNQVSLTNTLASIGLTYTDESKNISNYACKPLNSVNFLKRRFALQLDGIYLAPMELENILEMTNWIKGKARKQATLENCEGALTELALLGVKRYNIWADNIRKALIEVGLSLRIPTHAEQMNLYKHRESEYASVEFYPLW